MFPFTDLFLVFSIFLTVLFSSLSAILVSPFSWCWWEVEQLFSPESNGILGLFLSIPNFVTICVILYFLEPFSRFRNFIIGKSGEQAIASKPFFFLSVMTESLITKRKRKKKSAAYRAVMLPKSTSCKQKRNVLQNFFIELFVCGWSTRLSRCFRAHIPRRESRKRVKKNIKIMLDAILRFLLAFSGAFLSYWKFCFYLSVHMDDVTKLVEALRRLSVCRCSFCVCFVDYEKKHTFFTLSSLYNLCFIDFIYSLEWWSN